MECIICGNQSEKIFSNLVLDKHMVDYYQCKNCGMVFTEKPYWMEEAYSDAISKLDTGIMARNIALSMRTNALIKKFFDPDAVFLDFAGGYGIFTRMMRDKGFNFRWMDKYSKNLFAGGFEYTNEKIEMITAFEVFEHFEDPCLEVKNLLQLSDTILFSTLIYDEKLRIQDKDWWYYSFEGGQHISFYSRLTLEYIAKKNNLNYYCIHNGLHLFSKRVINPNKLKWICNFKALVALKWLKNRRKSFTMSDMELAKKSDV